MASVFQISVAAPVLYLCLICLSSAIVFPIRLNAGKQSTEGRLEVWFNNTWGTVCDDGFTDAACIVACRQMGLSGGRCVNEDGSHGCIIRQNGNTAEQAIYNDKDVDGTIPIWLDELTCSGTEQELGECRRAMFGSTDCGHKEDAGCICAPRPTVSPVRGSCLRTRHRIAPFTADVPNMGRVEVCGADGTWGLVCDDEWDDLDAIVFCNCLGYRGRENFRALLSPTHSSNLSVMYDSVHCNEVDTLSTKNIWECVTRPSTGQCDPRTEAAAILCGHLPSIIKPIPQVDVTCNGHRLEACFHSESDVILNHTNWRVEPNCSQANFSQAGSDVCININMSMCPASHIKMGLLANHYCYDVSVLRADLTAYGLLTDSTWTRRLCCIVAKNGTVSASFLPRMLPSMAVYAHNRQVPSFVMTCYRSQGSSSTNSSSGTGGGTSSGTGGERLSFPANVQRGEPLSCFINVTGVWNAHQTLVVTDCRFYSALSHNSASTLTFDFIRNKCPTTDDLGLIFYNVDRLVWGFRFNVPKFDGHDELYVMCDALICDNGQDKTIIKAECDRSCFSAIHQVAARSRRAVAIINSDEQWIEEESVTKGGPFIVMDHGYGPLITSSRQLVVEPSFLSIQQAASSVTLYAHLLTTLVTLLMTSTAVRYIAS